MANLENYFQQKFDQHLSELNDFLEIPSISALSEHKADIVKAAEWLCHALQEAGLENVKLLQTNGNPVVYADWLHAEGKPTMLIYGHYDVQPVDPVELWETPPFEPTVRDGKLFARGSSDDKGQVFMHVKAIEALLKLNGTLPVNVKFCVEGEEEVGSRNLPDFLEKEKELLACDGIVISDTTLFERNKPAICYALRGLCSLELSLRTAKGDLHSGLYGGGVPNALHVMAELLSSLHDRDGKVSVAGFYDSVADLTEEERNFMKALNFNEDKLKNELKLSALVGEKGYSYLERTTARPTLEINGMWGGFQGEGTKTVIPCEAHAKLTCRLVNHQNPDHIMDLIEEHVKNNLPEGASVKVTRLERGNPYLTPFQHPMIQAAARAYEHGYGVSPVFTRGGGSIPIVENFSRILQVPVVLMGFGLPEENFHAPNEHFHLENFSKGLLTICQYWYELSEAQ